jgi:hypothetical protein
MAIPIGKEAAAFKVVGVSTGGAGGVGGAGVTAGSFEQEYTPNKVQMMIRELADFIS